MLTGGDSDYGGLAASYYCLELLECFDEFSAMIAPLAFAYKRLQIQADIKNIKYDVYLQSH